MTSNCTFSVNVFKKFLYQGCGKGLIVYYVGHKERAQHQNEGLHKSKSFLGRCFTETEVKKSRGKEFETFIPLYTKGFPHGSAVICLICKLGVLGLSCTGSSKLFRGSVLGQDTSEPQPSTGETQERHE